MEFHYNNIIYRYKYTTDFMNVGIKLLNTEMKETINGHTDLTEHSRFFSVKLPTQVTMQPSSYFRPRL